MDFRSLWLLQATTMVKSTSRKARSLSHQLSPELWVCSLTIPLAPSWHCVFWNRVTAWYRHRGLFQTARLRKLIHWSMVSWNVSARHDKLNGTSLEILETLEIFIFAKALLRALKVSTQTNYVVWAELSVWTHWLSHLCDRDWSSEYSGALSVRIHVG